MRFPDLRRGRVQFLSPAPYRAKRLRDAARILPIFGAFLMVLPLLWSFSDQGRLLSRDLLYFFGLWLALVIVAALFAKGLMVPPKEDKGSLTGRLSGTDED